MITTEDACRYSKPSEGEKECIDCGFSRYDRQTEGTLFGDAAIKNEIRKRNTGIRNQRRNEYEKTTDSGVLMPVLVVYAVPCNGFCQWRG